MSTTANVIEAVLAALAVLGFVLVARRRRRRKALSQADLNRWFRRHRQ
jgi:MYXO-CTERM domain-containing protein